MNFIKKNLLAIILCLPLNFNYCKAATWRDKFPLIAIGGIGIGIASYLGYTCYKKKMKQKKLNQRTDQQVLDQADGKYQFLHNFFSNPYLLLLDKLNASTNQFEKKEIKQELIKNIAKYNKYSEWPLVKFVDNCKYNISSLSKHQAWLSERLSNQKSEKETRDDQLIAKTEQLVQNISQLINSIDSLQLTITNFSRYWHEEHQYSIKHLKLETNIYYNYQSFPPLLPLYNIYR